MRPVDEPLGPEFTELEALLVVDRPAPSQEFAREMDGRVARRFARAADAGDDRGGDRAPRPAGRPRRLRWTGSPVLGLAGAGLAALAAAVVIVAGSGSGDHSKQPLLPAGGGATAQKAAPAPGAPSLAGTPSVHSPSPDRAASAAGSTASPAGAPAPSASTSSSGAAQAVVPPANGRKVIQSSTLVLGAQPDAIEHVAQQVFNVVAAANGVVDTSSVTQTGGNDGYAHFALRVPSAALGRTMSSLSRLNGAVVVSRTDQSQDVNQEFVSAARQLADAQALRAALLKSLSAASDQATIDRLKARLAAAESQIATAQTQLRALQRQVDYSRIDLTVQAGAGAGGVTPVPGGGGFTLHRAAHDALRVLEVAAGVLLVALAVLVPLAAIGALAWWLASLARHRRREHALDIA